MTSVRYLVYLSVFISTLSYAEELVFHQGENRLTGRFLPAASDGPSKGVIVFVHGDGPSEYDAQGYFEIIWNQLRARGYAVFSWDKPGIGKSTGNWLDQSMRDRQAEVETAIKAVQVKYKFTPQNTGLMAYSQAGWVVPAIAADKTQVAFLIGIGFARNWIEQGRYLTLKNHSSSWLSYEEEGALVKAYNEEIDLFRSNPNYETYKRRAGDDSMDKDRFGFVIKNFDVDASDDYRNISVPTLLLWGAEDQNVDAKTEYQWHLQNINPSITPLLISDGTHALLNHYLFPRKEMGLEDWLKMLWYEEDGLADDFLPTMFQWLENEEQIIIKPK